MKTLSRLLLVSVLLVGCVGCDQLSKRVARVTLAPGEVSSYWGDTLRIVYAENSGAFLELGASLPASARVLVFQGGVAVLVLGLLWGAFRMPGLARGQIAALALLAASGLGNLIDRVLYDGRVTDFLNVGVGALRTGIFNVADVAGVIGVLLMLIATRRDGRRAVE